MSETPPPDFERVIKLLQRLAIGFGLLLSLAALLADPLGLSAAGFSRGQMLVLGIGLICILIGFLGQRFAKFYQGLALLLLNTLLMLVMIEIGAGVVSRIISNPEDEADLTYEGQPIHPYYAAQEWGAAYWGELNALQIEYDPYVVWRYAPFEGELISINAEGIRHTANTDCDNPNAYMVWVFGGSTVWGVGAPDWGTVPAYLQTILSQDENFEAVCVVNYGRSAYVSTQSLLLLSFALKSGDRPQAVIFYDGVNEVYAAYQSGLPHTHQNHPQIVARLYAERDREPFSETLREELIQNSYALGLLERTFGGGAEDSEILITYATMGIDGEVLAGEVAQHYLENYAFVEALGGAYGFESYFFWQPALALQTPQTPNEQNIYAALDPARITLYELVTTEVRAALPDYPHLSDLSNIFQDGGDYWIDDAHLTPEGNAIIAAALAEKLR